MPSPLVNTDIKSTTLPAALLEIAQKLQIAEQNAVPEKTNVSVSMNGEGTTVTVTASLPIDVVPSPTTGKLEVTATDYV